MNNIVWRPTTFQPHVLTLRTNGQCYLTDVYSGKVQNIFFHYKVPLETQIELFCDIAEPRDLGLQFLVIYGSANIQDINAFLDRHIDENHPMTPYRLFVLTPEMCASNPNDLLHHLPDSNIHFTGITLLS